MTPGTVIDDTHRALMTRARDLGRDFERLIGGLGKAPDLERARAKLKEAIDLVIKHLKK